MLYVLYEHATGYAVFQSIAAEDIGSQLDEVQQSMLDLAKFGKVLKLLSFAPFKSGANALENANSVSEGTASEVPNTRGVFVIIPVKIIVSNVPVCLISPDVMN